MSNFADFIFGDVRRHFMHRLFVAFHDTLGSYLHIASHEGGTAIVACLLAPRAKASWSPFPPSFPDMDSNVIFVIHVN
jgi:hypothetical protein